MDRGRIVYAARYILSNYQNVAAPLKLGTSGHETKLQARHSVDPLKDTTTEMESNKNVERPTAEGKSDRAVFSCDPVSIN